mmetsp:Transcript_5799/g.14741  ORF Transcript_5799/g.14741 Transcript_5799/m.14741 type:complete len:294 (-) Transcript_5799:42-923(-)|eukprot:CAMPEP_0177657906 /NCGR_PEP_ID=MMETSP0447-20121125/16488_1 /TAXON_ID=0 /ORGANISM="Stygamoeba regulata, Strain BSH-02190019" /LENGTH=293 /DNA_ID=CAMNT_0019162399 /DNA_START=67 /DNA_END=948 /DNA_ORIENTATION=+
MSNEAGAWDPLDEEEHSHSQTETEALLELQAVLGRDPTKKRDFINREADLTQAALRARLGPSSSHAELPWIETLCLSTGEVISIDGTQELALEELFVAQALQAAEVSYERFTKEKIPFRRPNDYFAEMVKSDQHMANVRRRLLAEKRHVEGIEERKRQREMRKYGKQIQMEKEKARREEKKKTLAAVKQWRKGSKPSDMDDDEFFEKLEAQQQAKAKGGQAQANNRKRSFKNEKYGFGGKKRRLKSNTRESAGDALNDYSAKRNKTIPSDLKKRMPKKTTKRSGKARRRQQGH